jgi:hypothetical protein
MSQKEISKQMLSLFNWSFSEVVTNKAIEDLSKASLTIGGTDDIMEFDSSIGHDLMERVSYGWYLGKCLDVKRLQYFKPEKVIKQGYIKFIGKNKIEISEFKNSTQHKLSSEAENMLCMRMMCGDDPKRVEIDEAKIKLGLPADNLFAWKENFEFHKHGKKKSPKKI